MPNTSSPNEQEAHARRAVESGAVPRQYKTLSGDVIELPPKISWRKRLLALQAVHAVFEGIGSADGSALMGIVNAISERSPAVLTKLVSILTGKPEEWIEENLEDEEVLRLADPFLASSSVVRAAIMQKFIPAAAPPG